MSDDRRNLIAQGSIALAVCFGGYMLFAEPARTSLAEERARTAALEAQVKEAEAIQQQVPQLTAALAAATAESDDIKRRGELARDERLLYSALVAAAERHRVQIDQLNPAKLARPSARAGSPEEAAARNDAAIAFSISATGAYADIAGFVESLQSDLGYSLVRSLSMAPRAETHTDVVRATIETAHFYFDPTPAGPAPAQQVAGVPGGS